MVNPEIKEKCCGCGACMNICPTNAIEMKRDEEGFSYPSVNKEKCVDCGLCDKICAFVKEKNINPTVKMSYAVKHKDSEILEKSTSGGMFTALSDWVLDCGGVVYGAAFDENFKVTHIRAETKTDRDKMRGSKYVQSDSSSIFKLVKKDLTEGKKVLFSGTPCQNDALRSYLNNDLSNVILCDIICHGVPSPMIFDEHLKFLSHKNKANVKEYYFRPKDWTWHAHNELSVFDNGKRYHSNAYSNLFRELYYLNLVKRPSCHACPYTNLNRPADITIADCRGVDKILPDFGSNEGVSLVLVNSEKGVEIFDDIKENLIYENIDLKEIMQPPMKGPSKPAAKRAEFFENYYKGGYMYAVKQHFGKYYFVKAKIKKLLKK